MSPSILWMKHYKKTSIESFLKWVRELWREEYFIICLQLSLFCPKKRMSILTTQIVRSKVSGCTFTTAPEQSSTKEIIEDDCCESTSSSNSSSQNNTPSVSGMVPRCKNPEPLGSSTDSTERTTESAVSTSSQVLTEPQHNSNNNSNITLVVPKFVRVSTYQQQQHNGTKEEDQRRKDAQVDFPTVQQHPIHHHQHESHRSITKQQHRSQSQQQQQQQTSSRSSSVNIMSCKTSIPSRRSIGKNLQHEGGSSINSSSFYSSHNNNNNTRQVPLFQRLVSDEVQEIKYYTRIIESQSRRLIQLERVHEDLEVRLEAQSNQRIELERVLEDREQVWTKKVHEIWKEKEKWKNLVTTERLKNSKLMDQGIRKDQTIHRMLQQKYDDEGVSVVVPMSIKNVQTIISEQQPTETFPLLSNHESPQVILESNNRSDEDFRERNIVNLLFYFFGLDS